MARADVETADDDNARSVDEAVENEQIVDKAACVAVMGHLLRNLALEPSNKSRFLAHGEILRVLLDCLALSARGPARRTASFVAVGAAVLWALTFNYKRVVPRLKAAGCAALCGTALSTLQMRMLSGNVGGAGQQHIEALRAQAVQAVVKLRQWVE